MPTPNLNVCNYRPVSSCEGWYGINARFNLLFQEVCALKNGGSGGGLKLVSIVSSNFQGNGITYLNPIINSGTNNTSIFWNDVNRFIYLADGEWSYVPGGINITIPGFNAAANSYHLEIFIK